MVWGIGSPGWQGMSPSRQVPLAAAPVHPVGSLLIKSVGSCHLGIDAPSGVCARLRPRCGALLPLP
ncbi:hypothetical protein FRACA_100026 [Frankia canadensis]|uniref:Uncharacterized protein n=1 Tax=Frankia canadensis TaxID=1836972 RepID=A0A2I2KIG4_9ACTN|nr:hypothetical protein FRACA_100026 [Frankia canadensis]SOU52748.1 hypothetical protein FRACA_100026 [Frankia canadensis]